MPNYNDAIEEIKSRCNIVDVIGSVITLKKMGSSYKACCPFHNEKTPSFNVSETRQFYHCFGCGESGDVISFYQKYYNLSFPDAVQKLAAQYGIEIETDNSTANKKRTQMLEINRLAARFFFSNIAAANNPGYKYITGRGILPETIKKFGLGYAGSNWTDLTDYFKKNGFKEELLLELGLVSKNKGKVYDKYRNRLMFPIIDTRGKVIGFGGRIIGDGEPKYLNSSESYVFYKKNNLFGLNLSKEYIQKEGFAILVEGYMDVVSLYQSGVCNVVASLGTALTENQAKLLHRYCNKVVLCYDADRAGIAAAIRGIDILRVADMDVSVLHVENAKDPDEFVKKYGKEAFNNLLNKKALNHVDYKVALISKKYDRSNPATGVKFIKAIAELIRSLNPAEQEVYTHYLSDKLSISEDILKKEINITNQSNKEPQKEAATAAEVKSDISKSDLNLERLVIKLCITNSGYYKTFSEYKDAFVSDMGFAISNHFKDEYEEGIDFDPERFKDLLSEKEYDYFYDILKNTILGDEAAAFNDCIKNLNNKSRSNAMADIKKSIEMLEDLPSSDERDSELNKLLSQLNELKKI